MHFKVMLDNARIKLFVLINKLPKCAWFCIESTCIKHTGWFRVVDSTELDACLGPRGQKIPVNVGHILGGYDAMGDFYFS
jgi:hypothetical protein